ncbi:hypothetical protein [Streptomyces sp. NPDC051310]|uniref:hypothetical protein n=1 Tax=Streptomyces sp. NPDC051310 TaxID=3365649 RepID=UPI0037909B0E
MATPEVRSDARKNKRVPSAVADTLTPAADYPVTVKVLCDILQDAKSPSATQAVTISITPWGLESADGNVEFEVHADQLITS